MKPTNTSDTIIREPHNVWTVTLPGAVDIQKAQMRAVSIVHTTRVVHICEEKQQSKDIIQIQI